MPHINGTYTKLQVKDFYGLILVLLYQFYIILSRYLNRMTPHSHWYK